MLDLLVVNLGPRTDPQGSSTTMAVEAQKYVAMICLEAMKQ